MSPPSSSTSVRLPAGNFATQWSLVFSPTAGVAPAQQALAELCLRYAYPVYVFLRRSGRSPAAAGRDLQACFHLLTEADTPASQALPRSPRFRGYLIEAVTRQIASNLPAVDFRPLVALAPEAMETRYLVEPDPALAAEPAYHRAFAREVLRRARQRLEAEAAQASRQLLYSRLEPFLAREPPAGYYDELAAALGSKPLSLAAAVKRLRQRFRELVDGELAETVACSEDLAAERQALRALLGG